VLRTLARVRAFVSGHSIAVPEVGSATSCLLGALLTWYDRDKEEFIPPKKLQEEGTWEF